MKKNVITLLTFVFTFTTLAAWAGSESKIEVKVDRQDIFIDSKFKGDKINISIKKYGSGKLATVFKSSKTTYKLYSKERVFGMWQNANPQILENMYKTYKIQTEANLIVSKDDIFKDLEIGVLNINLDLFENTSEFLKIVEYREALVKHQCRTNNYIEEFGRIIKLKTTPTFTEYLSEIEISKNIKPGRYLLEIFLIEEGVVRQFFIFNIDIESYDFIEVIKKVASENKVLYSILSIIVSILLAFFSFYLARILYYNRVK